MNGLGRISPGISTVGLISEKRGQNPTGLRLKTGGPDEWPKKGKMDEWPIQLYSEPDCFVDMCKTGSVENPVEVSTTTWVLKQSAYEIPINNPTLVEVAVMPGGDARMDLGDGNHIDIKAENSLATITLPLPYFLAISDATVVKKDLASITVIHQLIDDIHSVVCHNQHEPNRATTYPINVINGSPYVQITTKFDEHSRISVIYSNINGPRIQGAVPADGVAFTGQRAAVTIADMPVTQGCVDRSCKFEDQGGIFPFGGNVYHVNVVGNNSQFKTVFNEYRWGGESNNGTCRLGEPISRHEYPTNEPGVRVGLSEHLGPNGEFRTNGVISIDGQSFKYRDFNSMDSNHIQANNAYIVRLVETNGHAALRISKNTPQLDDDGFIAEEAIDLSGLDLNSDEFRLYTLYSSGINSHVLVKNRNNQVSVLSIDHVAMASTITTLIGEYLEVADDYIKIDSNNERALIVYKHNDVITKQWLDSTGLGNRIPVPSIDIKDISYGDLYPCIETNDIRLLRKTSDGGVELVSCDLDTSEHMVLWESNLTNKAVTDIKFKGENAYIMAKSDDGVYELTIVAERYGYNGGDKKTHRAYVWSFNLNAALNVNRLGNAPQTESRYMDIVGIGDNGEVFIRVEGYDKDQHYSQLTFALNSHTVSPFDIDTNSLALVNNSKLNANETHNDTGIIIKTVPWLVTDNNPPIVDPLDTTEKLPGTTPHGAQDETTSGSIIGPIIGASVGGVLGAALLVVGVRYRKELEAAASNIQATASNAILSMRNYYRELNPYSNGEGVEMVNFDPGNGRFDEMRTIEV